jgi:hypothetical protein
MVLDLNERLPGQKWAYGFMAGFLGTFAIVAFLVFNDSRQRSKLEAVQQPTAVGDPVAVEYDPRTNPGKELLRWKKENYFLQTNAPLDLAEADARRIGVDDSGKIQLYQTRQQSEKRIVLVKVGENQFLRLTPR